VARVVSGQTLEVTGIGEQPTRATQVRLVGIDAPVCSSTGKSSKTVRGDDWSQTVLLEFDVQDKDSLGRLLLYGKTDI